MKKLLRWLAPLSLALGLFSPRPASASNVGLWITDAEIAAWDTTVVADTADWGEISRAARNAGSGRWYHNATTRTVPNGGDQNSSCESVALAYALYYKKTGAAWAKTAGTALLLGSGAYTVPASGSDGQLPFVRNVFGYVVSASLLDLSAADSTTYRGILDGMLTRVHKSRTIWSTAINRPNNWGGFAVGTFAAAAAWINRPAMLDSAYSIFQDWAGRYPNVIANFSYQTGGCGSGGQCVQSYSPTPSALRPLNQACAEVQGYNLDGAVIDDWSRESTGGFDWAQSSTPCGGSSDGDQYSRETFLGLVCGAEVLYRMGYTDAYTLQDNSMLRGAEFFWRMNTLSPCCGTANADCWWPSGQVATDANTEGFIPIINKRYSKSYTIRRPTNEFTAGFNVCWTGMTHKP